MIRRSILFVLVGGLISLIACTDTGLTPQDQVADKGVRSRVEVMTSAIAAMRTLSNMMAGREQFRPDRASEARRDLVRATRAIPKRFRKPHNDPLSNARPEIWLYWDDFKIRAQAAEDAAKRLSTKTEGGLRRTLPQMLQACLSCHQDYRNKPNEFVTHGS